MYPTASPMSTVSTEGLAFTLHLYYYSAVNNSHSSCSIVEVAAVKVIVVAIAVLKLVVINKLVVNYQMNP